MKKMISRRSFSFLSLSLALHVLMAFALLWKETRVPSHEVISMEILEAPPAPRGLAPELKIEKTPKKKFDDQNPKIVDQDEKPLNDELDESARFLSQHNQRVQKQTVAQARGEFQNRAKTGRAGVEGAQNPSAQTMDRFLPRFDVVKSVEARDQREQTYDADAEKIMQAKKARPAARDVAQKAPSTGQEAAAGSDVSQTLDYIKELEPGLETMLSTKEFKFYTYFSRVRKQLNLHWTPKVRSKVTQIYRQGRRIASSDDLITRCLVTLDATGRLIKVQIIGNSGVIELDEAAVEAFRAAAPFPNPPKGMIDPDGTIKLRWDFILEA